MRQDNKCGIMKKPIPKPDLNHRPLGYQPGATLDKHSPSHFFLYNYTTKYKKRLKLWPVKSDSN